MTTPTLLFSEFGSPTAVLRLTEETLPTLSHTDLRILMRMCPINPSDINYIEGTYGIKPNLPAVAGLEGVGEIVEIGSQVKGFSVGQLVRPKQKCGLWRRELIKPANEVFLFPQRLTIEQASVASVNPPTAWCLLHEFVRLEQGDWVVQNAANSAVGRAVIRISKALGFRTINLVRRAELVEELKQQGADVVALPDDIEEVRATLGQSPVKLALNAVGGESALAVAKFLSPGGIHVTYGAMAKQPLKISNGQLIFKNLSFHGFWVTQWLKTAPPEKVAALWESLADLWQQGVLTPGIEKTYPLQQFSEALSHAQQPSRRGKIAFEIS